MMGSSHRK
jgi:hypothetical protein